MQNTQTVIKQISCLNLLLILKENTFFKLICVININTKYAFAEAMDDEDWKKKAQKIKLTNKDDTLVLRSFKRIEQDMVTEARVLNSIP